MAKEFEVVGFKRILYVLYYRSSEESKWFELVFTSIENVFSFLNDYDFYEYRLEESCELILKEC